MSDYSLLQIKEIEDKISDLEFALSEANRELLTEHKCITIARYLIAEANRNPFTSIGHWVEHGPCAEKLKDLAEHDEEQERAFGQWEKEQMGLT